MLASIDSIIEYVVYLLMGVSLGFSLIFSNNLIRMWATILTLQLIVHLPLNALTFPSNVQRVLVTLKTIVTLDFITPFFDLNKYIDYQPTSPYNDSFNAMGYTSTIFIENMATLNVLFLLLVASLLIFIPMKLMAHICAPCSRDTRTFFKNFPSRYLWPFFSKLVILAMLEVLFCIVIAVMPSEFPTTYDIPDWNFGDYFNSAFTWSVGVLTAGYVLYVSIFSCWFSKRFIRQI